MMIQAERRKQKVWQILVKKKFACLCDPINELGKALKEKKKYSF
jgi:hypothetical protein